MAETVRLTVDDGLATVRLSRPHGNAINRELVDDLRGVLETVSGSPDVGGMLLAAEGKLFCPGLDLQELVDLDRAAMGDFLERFSACILDLYRFPKPMVAALHGHAVAGGCVLALTADWRMLAGEALVGLNEVKVGVPFPFGVAMILRESVPSSRLEEIALFGRNYRGADAVAAGLAHEVLDADGFESTCRRRLAELAGKDPYAFSVTKRYLRAATVARILEDQQRLAPEFLDGWFADGTRQRIRGIVDQLRSQAR